MRIRAFVAIILAIVSGCAENPNRAYDTLQGAGGSRVVRSLSEAIRTPQPGRLAPTSEQSVEIAKSDQVIDLGGYYSYFKVFKIRSEVDTTYTITLRSQCHCLGHTKTMIVPRAFVLADHGELIAESSAGSVVAPSLSSGASMRGTVGFHASKGQDYYLVIAGDNSRVGAPLREFHEEIPNYEAKDPIHAPGNVERTNDMVVDYAILSSPVGKMHIQVKPIK